jgi:hypothetical protein
MLTNQVVISIDTEWVPDMALYDTLDLLNDYGINATLFSTHDDSISTDHERALHPNFNKECDNRSIFNKMLEYYPNSVGYRSHGLFDSTDLRRIADKVGMKYSSNYLLYKEPRIKPFQMPSGLIQFPIYWEDDIWFTMDTENGFDVESLLDPPGLKIFNFHPNHILYNTPSSSYYNEYKSEYYDKSTDVNELRYDGFGIRNIFIKLIRKIERDKIRTRSLGDLFMNSNIS